MSQSFQIALEKQSMNTLSSIKAAENSLNRSESTSADLLALVSSLRDYIAKQQNLVKKYQDGYDWTVLKNFSRRIIRCIDDLEKRMNAGNLSDSHKQDLEIIHDQFISISILHKGGSIPPLTGSSEGCGLTLAQLAVE